MLHNLSKAEKRALARRGGAGTRGLQNEWDAFRDERVCSRSPRRKAGTPGRSDYSIRAILAVLTATGAEPALCAPAALYDQTMQLKLVAFGRPVTT